MLEIILLKIKNNKNIIILYNQDGITKKYIIY